MPNTSNKSRVREFLARVARRESFTDSDDIFSLGFVNSMFAMELVLFVEKEFSITIGDTDLDIDNFKSVNAIAALIDRKSGGGGEP